MANQFLMYELFKVSVKLSAFDKPTTQVELSVIANLRLEPSHVVILPGDLIQIDIFQVIHFNY